MEPQTMDQILAQLDRFKFWSLKTIQVKDGRRRHECIILSDEPGRKYRKTYRASKASPQDACRLALAKANDKVGASRSPKLRITP